MDTESTERLLGLVEQGQFRSVEPQVDSPLRLTYIHVQEARGPESDEIDLSTYEGQALLVEGRADSGWVYQAEIMEVAGPILTTVVRQVFTRDGL